jgi:hypothetical protein
MAKYELIRETNASGDSYYFTERDGSYVEGSIKIDFTEAVEVFQQITERNTPKAKEIIKSVEI